ncbi:hypothetical protein [Humibacter sp.]
MHVTEFPSAERTQFICELVVGVGCCVVVWGVAGADGDAGATTIVAAV